jgi:hypothetical protein
MYIDSDPRENKPQTSKEGFEKEEGAGENDDFEEKYDANVDDFDEDDDFETKLDDPDEVD